MEDAAPSIPFWLQVAAIVLSPVVGFVGVAVGAVLTHYSKLRTELRNDRRDAYHKFSSAASSLHASFGMSWTTWLRTGRDDMLPQLVPEVKASLAELQGLMLTLELVGSRDAVRRAEAVYKWGLEAIIQVAAVAAKAEDFDRTKFDRSLAEGIEAMRSFRITARKDMGVTSAERETTSSDAELEEIMNRVQAAMKARFPDFT